MSAVNGEGLQVHDDVIAPATEGANQAQLLAATLQSERASK
jgi:hypothetical protein